MMCCYGWWVVWDRRVDQGGLWLGPRSGNAERSLSSPPSLAPRMPIDKKTILFRFPQHWPEKLDDILTLPMCDPLDFMASQNPSGEDLEDGCFDDTLVDPENASVAPTQRMKTFVKTASVHRVLPCDGSAVDDVKTASFRRALPCDGSAVDDVKTASFRRVLPCDGSAVDDTVTAQTIDRKTEPEAVTPQKNDQNTDLETVTPQKSDQKTNLGMHLTGSFGNCHRWLHPKRLKLSSASSIECAHRL